MMIRVAHLHLLEVKMNKFFMLLIFLVCIFSSALSIIWLFFSIFTAPSRFIEIAFGVDQTANATFGGRCDEKISSRAYRMSFVSRKWYYIMRFIDLIFYFEDMHCKQSFLNDFNESSEYASKYKDVPK